MPTYELICRDCGHRFDKFVMRLLRHDDKVCPVCGSTHVDQGLGGGYAAPIHGSTGSVGCAPRGGFS